MGATVPGRPDGRTGRYPEDLSRRRGGSALAELNEVQDIGQDQSNYHEGGKNNEDIVLGSGLFIVHGYFSSLWGCLNPGLYCECYWWKTLEDVC